MPFLWRARTQGIVLRKAATRTTRSSDEIGRNQVQADRDDEAATSSTALQPSFTTKVAKPDEGAATTRRREWRTTSKHASDRASSTAATFPDLQSAVPTTPDELWTDASRPNAPAESAQSSGGDYLLQMW